MFKESALWGKGLMRPLIPVQFANAQLVRLAPAPEVALSAQELPEATSVSTPGRQGITRPLEGEVTPGGAKLSEDAVLATAVARCRFDAVRNKN